MPGLATKYQVEFKPSTTENNDIPLIDDKIYGDKHTGKCNVPMQSTFQVKFWFIKKSPRTSPLMWLLRLDKRKPTSESTDRQAQSLNIEYFNENA